jgi:hypothetical protein
MDWDATPSGKRGRQQAYSDPAIHACLTIKVLFGLPLRQATGFVESLLKLVSLDWSVPDLHVRFDPRVICMSGRSSSCLTKPSRTA